MARYAIGDIQGCYSAFIRLLSKIGFNPGIDTLYLVGDLVNRGSESLQILQWAYKYQDILITVLGNHDIYLLARYNNIRSADRDDTLGDIIIAPEAVRLIAWLRSCPLVYQDDSYILVHAGIYPRMDFNHLLLLNHLISQHLQAPDYASFINYIYGNKPNLWHCDLPLNKQLKFAINACTRMRYLNLDSYALDYKYKGEIRTKAESLIPWFNVAFHASIKKKIIFGHWASLGLYQNDKCIGLDTGCVWGRKLTAFNLDTNEIIQVENS